ncbi:MAG: hypothetical protein ACRDPB_05685, partial [Nocardioidaceae bacterium]
HDQGRRPRREETIAWPVEKPIGVGHADLFVPSEHLIVEVVSNAGGSLPEEKVTQAALYTLNHRNADHAVVLSVDTHTGDEHIYPIDLSGVEPRVRAIEEQVVHGCATGELPDRVCRTPFDGPAQFCPFVETCFEGWEFPPLEELLADSAELEQLADTEDLVSDARKAMKDAEEKRDVLRDRLRPLVPANVEAVAGQIQVKRSEFSKTSFSLADARKAGHTVPAELAPFVKTSSQERWTVRRVEP